MSQIKVRRHRNIRNQTEAITNQFKLKMEIKIQRRRERETRNLRTRRTEVYLINYFS
jgi:hypothetical protein